MKIYYVLIYKLYTNLPQNQVSLNCFNPVNVYFELFLSLFYKKSLKISQQKDSNLKVDIFTITPKGLLLPKCVLTINQMTDCSSRL